MSLFGLRAEVRRLQCLSVRKILPEMRGCGELTEDVYSKKTVF